MAVAPRLVTLVTGANRGLGFELAKQLLRLGGFHVIAAARNWDREAGSSRDLLQGAFTESSKTPSRHVGGLDFVDLDVTSTRSRYELQGSLASILGREQKVNVLVNNAGIYPPGWDAESFANCMATNTIGPLRLAEELVPFYASDAQVVRVQDGRSTRVATRRHALRPCNSLQPLQPRYGILPLIRRRQELGQAPLPYHCGHLSRRRMQVNVTSGYGKTRFLSDAYKAALASCDSVDDLERKIVFKSDDPVLGKAGAEVPAYKLSKAALNRGTQILAKSFKGTARVNSVEPGWCKTDM